MPVPDLDAAMDTVLVIVPTFVPLPTLKELVWEGAGVADVVLEVVGV